MKTKLILSIFSMMIVGLTYAAEKTPNKISGTTKVTAEQIVELVEKYDNLVIIDARKESDRAKGYIEGSHGLPNTSTNYKKLQKLISTKTTPVVFYCNGVKCGRSVESSKIAVKAGYKNIYWFRGGWDEWTQKKMPVTRD